MKPVGPERFIQGKSVASVNIFENISFYKENPDIPNQIDSVSNEINLFTLLWSFATCKWVQCVSTHLKDREK